MVKEEVEQESGTEEVPTAQARRRRKVTATPKDTSTAIGKTANAKTPLVPEPKAATTVFREKKIAALENGERANGMDGEGDDASLVPTTSTSRSAAAVGGKRVRKAEVTNEGKEQAVMKEEDDKTTPGLRMLSNDRCSPYVCTSVCVCVKRHVFRSSGSEE